MKEINIFNKLPGDIAKLILEKSHGIFPGLTAAFVNSVAYAAQAKWADEAIKKSPWGSRYASTLKVDPASENKSSAEVYADDSSPNMLFVNLVESGMKPWNITAALLESKKAKKNASGLKYIRIPFRWATPKKDGEAKPGSMFAGELPKDIYKAAKAGEKISAQIQNKYGKLVDITGLKRYGGAKHGQYMTFRTVSESSKPWIHPGKPATPVFPSIVKWVEGQIAQSLVNMVEQYMQDLEKGIK